MRTALEFVGVGVIAVVIFALQRSGSHHELDAKHQRQEVETLRAMFAADTAVVGVDSDGVITSWNWAATVLAGWTQDELLGKRLEAVMPRDKRDAHRSKFDKVTKMFPDRNVHADCELLHKLKENNGAERRVPVAVEMINLGGGSYVALMRKR